MNAGEMSKRLDAIPGGNHAFKGSYEKKTFKVKIKKNVVKYFRERITPKVKCRMY